MDPSLSEIRLSAYIAALKAELLEAASFGRSDDPAIPEFILAEVRASFFYEPVALKGDSLIVSLNTQNIQGARAKRLSQLSLVFKDEDILGTEAEGKPSADGN